MRKDTNKKLVNVIKFIEDEYLTVPAWGSEYRLCSDFNVGKEYVREELEVLEYKLACGIFKRKDFIRLINTIDLIIADELIENYRFKKDRLLNIRNYMARVL